MSSKEAFERLLKYAYINASEFIIKYGYSALNDVELIKQDLERLEKLEDNIKIHKETIKMQHNQIEKFAQENDKLKKVIEILKDKFEIEITKTFCPRIIITETNELENNNNVSEFLTQEEYDLLKEFL